MRCFTLPALAAAALCSAVAALAFLPSSRAPQEHFTFEVVLASSVDGNVQIYYDQGSGFDEADSQLARIGGKSGFQTCRLDLPPGRYPRFRFDPIDREGTVVIRGARILDYKGAVVRNLPLGLFKPLNQIASLTQSDAGLTSVTTAGGNDPQLLIEFDPPLRLSVSWTVIFAPWARRALPTFAALALALFALDRSRRVPGWIAASLFWARARPLRAVAIVAAAATVLSAYPVVLLGKSYVSPNFGTLLLYGSFPTLPGYGDAQTTEVKGSDVGAIMWQQVPYSMNQRRALLMNGELPLWNRYNSAGQPMLGQGQTMAGDPLHLLVVAANGAAWAWDLKYLIAKWLFALSLGWLILALVRHLPSAALVALAAPFIGFFVYRINHPAFFSLCYAPWTLYCWVRVAQAQGRRSAAGWLAGLMLAELVLMASGTVKEAYMLLLVMNFAGLCAILASEESRQRRLAKLGGAAWALALFTLISAPFWGSFLATLKGAYTSYDVASAYQIQPGILLGAFDEAFYRPLSRGDMVFNPSANFLILAGLLYFLATLKQQVGNRTVIALAAATLLPLSLAFGLVPPSWIIRTPFLANVAHLDNSFSCGLIILWAVLAGAGFASAARRLGGPDGKADLAVGSLLLFGLVFSYIAFCQAVHRSVFGPAVTYSPLAPGQSLPIPSFLWGYLASLLAALGIGGWTLRRALQRRQLTAPVALVLGLCVAATLWRQGMQAGYSYPDFLVHPPPRVNFHAPSGAVQVVRDAMEDEPYRVVGIGNNLFPGWNDVYGLEGISGPDALMNPYYRNLAKAAPIDMLWDWRLVLSSEAIGRARPFLDFLNVRYYLGRGEEGPPGSTGLRRTFSGDLDVWESPTAWPRAFFTDQVLSYRDVGQLVGLIQHGDGRPFAALSPEDSSGIPVGIMASMLSAEPASRLVVPAERYRLTGNTTSFEVDAPGPGVIVLQESYWAGYSHAELDGRPVHVLRVNHAFEGVAVGGPGLHQVRFSYAPRLFPLCLGACALGLLLTAGSCTIAFRRPGGRNGAGHADRSSDRATEI